MNNRTPNLQSLHTRTDLGRQIKEAFMPISPFIDCDYTTLEKKYAMSWVDSLGQCRSTKEPARRAYLRRHLQGTRDPIEHKHALETLQEFDREWK